MKERQQHLVDGEARERAGMTFGTLMPFLALTFGLTWGLAAIFIVLPHEIEAIFGQLSYTHPLFIIAVYSPGIAGVLLVWRHHGASGVGSYLRRLALWRMPFIWWLFLIVGIPASFYLGAALSGSIVDPLPRDPWHEVLPTLLTALFIGPIEELGWRGVALPLLQRRFAPLWASLILGVVWATWHIPAFLVGGTPQEGWALAPYFIAVVAISVILTPMFNAARGSILIAALFHFQVNNPLWPDAQPWDALVFGVTAVAVVVLNRERMLAHQDAATEILTPEPEARGQ